MTCRRRRVSHEVRARDGTYVKARLDALVAVRRTHGVGTPLLQLSCPSSGHGKSPLDQHAQCGGIATALRQRCDELPSQSVSDGPRCLQLRCGGAGEREGGGTLVTCLLRPLRQLPKDRATSEHEPLVEGPADMTRETTESHVECVLVLREGRTSSTAEACSCSMPQTRSTRPTSRIATHVCIKMSSVHHRTYRVRRPCMSRRTMRCMTRRRPVASPHVAAHALKHRDTHMCFMRQMQRCITALVRLLLSVKNRHDATMRPSCMHRWPAAKRVMAAATIWRRHVIRAPAQKMFFSTMRSTGRRRLPKHIRARACLCVPVSVAVCQIGDHRAFTARSTQYTTARTCFRWLANSTVDASCLARSAATTLCSDQT
jgi:hypothetical protein